VLDAGLSPRSAKTAGRQREQGPGDRLHHHAAHLLRQSVPGHVHGAQFAQHIGRGAGG